jgi:hypothetical protein
MSVLTKDEIESLLQIANQENEKLRNDNERYLFIIAHATERIRLANDMAETYQRMFNELFEVIEIEYDANFIVKEIPNRPS